MFEEEMKASLARAGSRENKVSTRRWLTISAGVFCGEAVAATTLAFAVANFGRNWPAAAQISMGVAWYLQSAALAIYFFQRVKEDLGRDHEPAVPRWLLKGFGIFLFSPILLTLATLYAPNNRDPSLLIGCTFILGSIAWAASLAFYTGTLWLQHFFNSEPEIISLAPAEDDDLADATKRYFDARSEAFEMLGFDELGDFLQKPVERQFARMFLGAGGKFVGEAIVNESSRLQAYSVVSLLADGTFIETCPFSIKGPPPEGPTLVLLGDAGRNEAEVLASHGDLVQRLCAERDTEPLALQPHQLEVVMRYGVSLAMDEAIRHGALNANPYAPLEQEIQQGMRALLPEKIEV